MIAMRRESVPRALPLPGRAVACEQVDIRPRVDGVILVDPGTPLSVGDPLHRLDAASYEADPASALNCARTRLGRAPVAAPVRGLAEVSRVSVGDLLIVDGLKTMRAGVTVTPVAAEIDADGRVRDPGADTATDVTDAVSAQNTNVTVGALVDPPTTRGQQVTFSPTAQPQLPAAQECERILLLAKENGFSVYLGHAARVGAAPRSYGSLAGFSGHPAASFGVDLATGTNAADTAEAVRAEAWTLTAIQGLGVTAGFSMRFADQGGQGTAAMNAAAAELLAQAAADGRAASPRGAERLARTALRLDIDQQKSASLGVSLSSVNDILSTAFAGGSVNAFTLGARLRATTPERWTPPPPASGCGRS
ncbi:MAG: hypothetical protein CML43_02585 [Rhodobacteraceae bacterium]|nr:hypothetical protein [Paracoccaceae bacterium]